MVRASQMAIKVTALKTATVGVVALILATLVNPVMAAQEIPSIATLDSLNTVENSQLNKREALATCVQQAQGREARPGVIKDTRSTCAKELNRLRADLPPNAEPAMAKIEQDNVNREVERSTKNVNEEDSRASRAKQASDRRATPAFQTKLNQLAFMECMQSQLDDLKREAKLDTNVCIEALQMSEQDVQKIEAQVAARAGS